MNEREEKLKELTGQITDFVNTFSLNQEAFNEAMSREHRTLQQSFTRLCLKWIEYCASDEYQHDLRNKASHDISKRMLDAVNQTLLHDTDFKPSDYLPMI